MTELEQAQAQYDKFADKHNAANAALTEARTALKATQKARTVLLDAIAEGAPGKSATDLAAADADIRTAAHEVELHEGLAEAAKRAKDRSQVTLWQAQAADIKSRLRDATADQIQAGKVLDAALEVAKKAVDAFNGLSLKISGITHEGHSHDLGVLTEGKDVSALSAHQSQWPKTRIQGHPPQSPVFVKLQQEDRGWPARDVNSAEQLALGTQGYFGPNLNAA